MPSAEAIDAIVHARHGDPFAVLGQHAEGGALVVNAFVPGAERVVVFDAETGDEAGPLALVHGDGFFSGAMPERDAPFPYRLRAERGGDAWEIADPYAFGRVLGELDEHLIAEGTHLRAYERLGAHVREVDGVAGVAFAVWAPNAERVSVVGSFNAWDGRRNPMRRTAGGVWELFLPDAREGDRYEYELLGPGGEVLPLKADPYAFACEPAPGTASIVARAGMRAWTDEAWLAGRGARQRHDAPVTIYEVHLGSWKRGTGDTTLTYRELATDLVPYAAGLGFTHIELLPVAEHPFYGSWGYQTIGMFAPASRYGSPAEFAAFVDAAHAAGLGVILDWVPGHFPTDAHGLGRFDGTHLYEHADPRQGFQPDWNTLVFNFERSEVVNYLVSNALFWLETYHIDGLRVDAVASMLYLDFSRAADAWVPNEFGGRENLGAVRFLRRVNDVVHAESPGAVTMAEESSDWPGVSAPVAAGGLGFDYKWNMGWMHDGLDYMRTDPLYRGYGQNQLTFSFMYAYTERFVLPLSHDEVVYGKRSLLGKMPGDEWQRFANLRAYFGFMWAHPGKKLLFMGGEFAQEREWNHDRSLDWHLFADPRHAGMQTLVGDLNRSLRALPSLYELDMEQAGLEFLRSDRENCVVAFARRDRSGGMTILVTNFTPVPRWNYRFGIPDGPDAFVEAINTDAVRYGGGGVHNDVLYAEQYGMDGKPRSLNMTLPPLATVILKPA